MNRRALGLLIAVVLWRCAPEIEGAPCDNSSQCPTGQFCTALSLCALGQGEAMVDGGAVGDSGVISARDSGVETMRDSGVVTPFDAGSGRVDAGSTMICGSYYRDADGDGFGAGALVQACSTTVGPPAGYSTKNGDCCDSDVNAAPGKTGLFATANACGSFDYDCDGQATQELTMPACGPMPPAPGQCPSMNCMGGAGWLVGGTPACGASANFAASCAMKACAVSCGTGCLQCEPAPPEVRTQRCR